MTTPQETKAPQHTPGPWHVEERVNCHAVAPVSGHEIVFVNRFGSVTVRDRSDDEVAANARLIAAAPALLAALQGAAAYLEHAAKRLRILGDDSQAKVIDAQARNARAALALVHGREGD